MPYDKNLDECLVSKAWESDGGRLVVSVFSYNKGTKKLQIHRENRNADGELRFSKLGRMTRDEVEAVLPMIQELFPQMD